MGLGFKTQPKGWLKSITDRLTQNETDISSHNHDDRYYSETEIDSKLFTINTAVEEATAIAKGRGKGKVFDTLKEMQTWLKDSANAGILGQSDNLYIRDTGVPDYWVANVLTEPNSDGYYYDISELETQKVDLTEYDEKIAKNAYDITSLNNDLANNYQNTKNLANAINELVTTIGSTDISAIGADVKAAISSLNTALANKASSSHTHEYLPLSGGMMTRSWYGNNGAEFATDGNIYSEKLYGGWLSNRFNRCVQTDGSFGKLDPVTDINNFYNGVATFSGSALNNPIKDWGLVIAGGIPGTCVQVIYGLFDHRLTYHRYCASGTWSEWLRPDDLMYIEPFGGAMCLRPFGNVVVCRTRDNSTYGEIQAAVFSKLSSKYAKDNIEDMTNEEVDKILKLRAVTFDYKKGSKNQAGFIAEEVLKILPNCVTVPDNYVEDPDASEIDLPRLDYSKFVPYLVKEIQILNDRITKLEENK